MFPAGLAEYQTHFLDVGGLTVRVVEHVAPGRASGPAVMCIHGWGCSAFVWRKNLPALHAAGLRALAMDLPGHGLSDKPLTPARYTAGAMAERVLATLDALGVERAALVAHSMGAIVASRAAAMAPERISALVLLAPAGVGVVPYVALTRALTPRALGRIAPHLAWRWVIAAGLRLARAGTVGEPLSEREVDEYWAPTQFPAAVTIAWNLLHDFDWTVAPRAANVRTLVILGSRDHLVHARAEPTDHIIPGAGHNVQEQAPEVVNALVSSFLTP